MFDNFKNIAVQLFFNYRNCGAFCRCGEPEVVTHSSDEEQGVEGVIDSVTEISNTKLPGKTLKTQTGNTKGGHVTERSKRGVTVKNAVSSHATTVAKKATKGTTINDFDVS